MKKQNVWKSLKGTGDSGRWLRKRFCRDFTPWCQGFQSCAWFVHTHAHQPGRGEPRKESPWEENESIAVSLSRLFTAMCFAFQSLQTSTFLGVLWNKEFGQRESKKGLYFSIYSTRFEGILCWGRVAVLCLKHWNWHLKILKLNYMQ